MNPQRQRLDPDIQVKYHQIVAHMNQKNKVIQQFCKILKDLCDWQMFNSKNLDKFANSLSKLLIGKDPLKDTFIIFERILASKSQQSNKIAMSIKQDMLPFLQKAINIKDQTLIKSQQQPIKQMKLVMHQKVRQLYSAQTNYKNINQKLKSYNNGAVVHSRQKIQQMTKIKRQLIDSQAYLSEVINVYNHAVQDYMLNYSKLCQQLSQIQTNRKTTIKQSISKYIVFEMDAIKNIQYDLCRHAKSIQKMQDKLIIQQKISHDNQYKSIQLAKISSNNYIQHLISRQNKNQSSNYQTQTQKKLNQIKKFLDPLKQSYQINKQSYNNLIQDINQLLFETIDIYDIKTVKQIVYYSSNYYMLSSYPTKYRNNENVNTQTQQITFRRTKIPLLNGILSHPIFKNQSFWEKYNNRLNDIVQKQIISSNNNSYRKTDQVKLSISLLSSDIQFMKKISSCPIIDKILLKYSKYTTESSEHILKSTDSIKTKTESSSKHKLQNKENKSDLQKIQQKINAQDYVFF